MSHETPKILRCMDCGLLYCDFPLDTTLPDEQWSMLHDSPGGVLCACCIVRRAAKLPGVIAVRAVIEFEAPASPPAADTGRAVLAEALHSLVSRLMVEADEADHDGDICCALTRRHDAVAILAVLGETREEPKAP